MTNPRRLRLRLLRLVLVCCGLTWGASVVGVFVSWETAARMLEGLGANPVAYDRMLDYWLRLAAGAFSLLGIGYLVLALQPRKYAAVLPWAAWLMLIEGIVLAWHGLRLGLPPFPFYADVSACGLGGIALLMLRDAANTPDS
jgi:hypothetical protein